MSQRVCDVCGGPMDGRPSNAKYCGPVCAQSVERGRNQALATQGCSRATATAIVRLLEVPSVLELWEEREAERRQLAAEGLL